MNNQNEYKYLIMVDEKAKEKAIEIFGEGIILDVYKLTMLFSFESKEQVISKLIRIEYDLNGDELRFDEENIAIKFITGNIVMFSSSEWGAMERLKNFEEIT
ncbi:MAG: hypothetical protein FIA82_08255 [Melioribacter sp.]|nr:hypothetical protein [Melioribacter sp.]